MKPTLAATALLAFALGRFSRVGDPWPYLGAWSAFGSGVLVTLVVAATLGVVWVWRVDRKAGPSQGGTSAGPWPPPPPLHRSFYRPLPPGPRP